MSLKTRWIAACILLLINECFLPEVTTAQEPHFGGSIPARVVSVYEDPAGKWLSFIVKGKQPLPVPVIQYFPGPDGKTIMAIDFPGLVRDQPSIIMHPENAFVELVRIGQFQSNPPVFRVSITTSNPALLRKIDLRANGDRLIVKFPDDGSSNTAATTGMESCSSDNQSVDSRQKNYRDFKLHNATQRSSSSPLDHGVPTRSTTVAGVEPESSSRSITDRPVLASRRALASNSTGGIQAPAASKGSTTELPTLRPPIPLPNDFAGQVMAERAQAKASTTALDSKPRTRAGTEQVRSSDKVASDAGNSREPRSPVSETPESERTWKQSRYNRAVPGKPAAPSGIATEPGHRPVAEAPEAQAPDAPAEQLPGPARGLRARFLSVFPPLAPPFFRRHSRHDTAKDAPADNDGSQPGRNRGAEQITGTSDRPGPSANIPVSDTPNIPAANTRENRRSTARKDQPAGVVCATPPLAPDLHLRKTGRTEQQSRTGLHLTDLPPVADNTVENVAPTTEPQPADSSSVIIAGQQPLQLLVKGCGPIKYRSFRLSDPPRYVLDFIEGSPADGTLPESPCPDVLKAIRSGRPDGDNSAVRLVLDLADPMLSVKEELQPGDESLMLTLVQETAQRQAPAGTVTVVLDAGHGGSDPGAQRGDLREKDMTMGITLKLKKNLEKQGIRVVLTRSDDTFVSLEDRVRITNEVKPDCFVSVHINSLESDSHICGIETYYQNDCSRPLAGKIHQSLVGQLQVPDRSVRKARFYVVNHTPHPAILAEVGFISNKQEREKLMSNDYQGKIADALNQGIIMYLSETRNIARQGACDSRRPAQTLVAPNSAGRASSMGRSIFTR